jgi:redox-sensitive bicupin YhaK (pirin superfamily)
MMISLRRNKERRHIQCGKQEIWHTFYPRDHPGPLGNGFGSMVVLDEMRLSPGESAKPHRGDGAEVVTYVYKGALSQEDSTGDSGVIHAGEFQQMSLGHGIRHKETNASQSDWAHIFRISLRPSEAALNCAHEEKRFTAAQRRNVLCVVASLDGRKGSLRIHQDALVYSSILDTGHHVFHALPPGRTAWLHVVYGGARLNGIVLTQGDSVGVMSEPSVSLTVQENTELLLVDTIPNFGKPGQLKESI